MAKNAATAILGAARDALDRQAAVYDREGGERSAGKIAAAWSAVTGKAMTAAEAWLFLVLLKAVRLHGAPADRSADSAIDGAAYFGLMGEQKLTDAGVPVGVTTGEGSAPPAPCSERKLRPEPPRDGAWRRLRAICDALAFETPRASEEQWAKGHRLRTLLAEVRDAGRPGEAAIRAAWNGVYGLHGDDAVLEAWDAYQAANPHLSEVVPGDGKPGRFDQGQAGARHGTITVEVKCDPKATAEKIGRETAALINQRLTEFRESIDRIIADRLTGLPDRGPAAEPQRVAPEPGFGDEQARAIVDAAAGRDAPPEVPNAPDGAAATAGPILGGALLWDGRPARLAFSVKRVGAICDALRGPGRTPSDVEYARLIETLAFWALTYQELYLAASRTHFHRFEFVAARGGHPDEPYGTTGKRIVDMASAAVASVEQTKTPGSAVKRPAGPEQNPTGPPPGGPDKISPST